MSRVAPISQIKPVVLRRASTGIEHLDWLWGYTKIDGNYWWGIPQGKITLFSGVSGVGKSRVLITLAKSLVQQGRSVLYFQSEVNLEDFAGWVKGASNLNNFYCSDADTLADQVTAINTYNPDIVIVDSINEVEDFGSGSKGNVKEVISIYRDIVRRLSNHIILVGQLNQDGTIKGSTTLPHLVDAVFDIVPACKKSKKTFIVKAGIKNRYGRCGTQFYTYWEHTEDGAVPCVVDDNKLEDEIWCEAHGVPVRNMEEYRRQLAASEDNSWEYPEETIKPKFSVGRALARLFMGPG